MIIPKLNSSPVCVTIYCVALRSATDRDGTSIELTRDILEAEANEIAESLIKQWFGIHAYRLAGESASRVCVTVAEDDLPHATITVPCPLDVGPDELAASGKDAWLSTIWASAAYHDFDFRER